MEAERPEILILFLGLNLTALALLWAQYEARSRKKTLAL
jgi:hypothetical protein